MTWTEAEYLHPLQSKRRAYAWVMRRYGGRGMALGDEPDPRGALPRRASRTDRSVTRVPNRPVLTGPASQDTCPNNPRTASSTTRYRTTRPSFSPATTPAARSSRSA
jgi:hypothetical protein